MDEKTPGPVSCRPTTVARDRINYAKKLGLSESGYINDLIENFGRQYLEKVKKERAESIKKLLSDPVP